MKCWFNFQTDFFSLYKSERARKYVSKKNLVGMMIFDYFQSLTHFSNTTPEFWQNWVYTQFGPSIFLYYFCFIFITIIMFRTITFFLTWICLSSNNEFLIISIVLFQLMAFGKFSVPKFNGMVNAGCRKLCPAGSIYQMSGEFPKVGSF